MLQMSLLQILPLVSILTPALCQYADVRPDVKFDDRNDRFDIKDLTDTANQYFENLEGSKLKFRRSGHEERSRKSRRSSKMEHMSKAMIEANFLTEYYLAKIRNKDTKAIKRKYKLWRDAWERNGFLKLRRMSGDLDAESFAFHDSRSLEYGGNKEDYEKNLALMQRHDDEKDYRRKMQKHVDYLHGALGNDLVSRRSNPGKVLDPENELLLHHAVPFKVKIQGYLQTPQLN